MKWKDLSLKERKQIYDSVRVNNPDATYFDIKEQFDSIPTYEDGKGKTIAEPFTPTITKKKGKKVKTEADYDQEFAEVKRKYNNMQEYEKELSKITNDLFVFNDGSIETLEKVDKAYGTNYKKAASAIAFQDIEWAVPLGLPVFFGEEQENK